MRGIIYWQGGIIINKRIIYLIKNLISFLSDKKLLIGIGIGIIIGAVAMVFNNYNYQLSRAQIEEKARGYGMNYPDEIRVIFDNKNHKSK